MAKMVRVVRKTANGTEIIAPMTGVDAIPDFGPSVASALSANVVVKNEAQWNTASSTVLLNGQFGLNTTNYKVKIGDGSTTWANLNYITADATLNVVEKTAAEWASDSTTILGLGQIGRDTTNNFIKIGDGSNNWAALTAIHAPTDNNVIVKTSAQWSSASSTVLPSGTIGLESDTGFTKIGDGSSTWANLTYTQTPTDNNVVIKTASQWSSASSTVLKAGQLGYESDTGYMKVGDGSTTWANLVYAYSPKTNNNIVSKTAAQWTNASSTVLAAGQIGFDTTNNWAKMGDGSTTWANLPYLHGPYDDSTVKKTATQWASASSTVLKAGQLGIDTTNNWFKIGDGSTTWTNLAYMNGPASPHVIRKTAAQWTSASSTVLAAGVIGIDTTNWYIKIGDGSTTWANLKYINVPSTTVELKSGSTTTVTDTITLTLS